MAAVLALIGNLSMLETLVIAVIAILVFGQRLPEVAVRCVRWIQGVRGSLDKLRRETGLDDELRSVQNSIRDVTREATIENPLRLPAEPRRERGAQPPETGETPGPPPSETESDAETPAES